ncbi:hypothetical protein I4U23_014947 [Adineta vaga]|nr:hypothetical protein I4U23_014947 [Adineta vaga]
MFGGHLLHHHHIPHAGYGGFTGGNFAAPTTFGGSYPQQTGFSGAFGAPNAFSGGFAAPSAFGGLGFSGPSFGGGGGNTNFPAGFGSPYGYSPF